MRTARYCLILAAVGGFFCVCAWRELEVPRFDEAVLLGQSNPAMAGIEKLFVFIVPSGAEPNKDGLIFKELEAEVKNKVQEAGMKTDFRITGNIFHIPELRIDVGMLRLEGSGEYVFHIQTSLARAVVLPTRRNLYLKTEVWKVGPVMEAVSTEGMSEKVTEAVLGQVETFINCYLVANPKGNEPADANETGSVEEGRPKAVAESAPAKYKYVGSSKSRVFHRSDCSSAGRILPQNLVGYNSREAAVKAGKRPCKQCKP